MLSTFRAAAMLCSAVAAAMVGCSNFVDVPKRGLPSLGELKDTLGLDVFFIDRPLQDPLLGAELWEMADEQFLALPQRRALEQNGFRVGLTGGQMPEALQSLLGLDDQPQEAFPPGEWSVEGEPGQLSPPPDFVSPKTLAEGPWGRHLLLRKGIPYRIAAAGPLDACTVLLKGPDGAPTARPFPKAQFQFQLSVRKLSRENVELEFHPETHYGDARPRLNDALNGGTPYGQDVETYPHLNWTATLTPGQMVLITMWPQRSESLGWHFFSRDHDADLKQRVIVVRVSRLSADNPMFSAMDP